jgi:hypothetical protein
MAATGAAAVVVTAVGVLEPERLQGDAIGTAAGRTSPRERQPSVGWSSFSCWSIETSAKVLALPT